MPEKRDHNTWIKQLIVDDIETFFEKSKKELAVDSKSLNEVLIIEGDYKRLRKSQRIGIVEPELIRLRMNQLSAQCIDLIDSMENNEYSLSLDKNLDYESLALTKDESYKNLQEEYFNFADEILNVSFHNITYNYLMLMGSATDDLENCNYQIFITGLNEYFDTEELTMYIGEKNLEITKILKNIKTYFKKFESLNRYERNENSDKIIIFHKIKKKVTHDFELLSDKLSKVQKKKLKSRRNIYDLSLNVKYLKAFIKFLKWKISSIIEFQVLLDENL